MQAMTWETTTGDACGWAPWATRASEASEASETDANGCTTLERTSQTFRDEFLKSRSQSRTTAVSNPGALSSFFFPPTRTSLRESRPPLMSTGIPDASAPAPHQEIPARESERTQESGFFRLGVPVPHKRKYLHKRNECVQGPARGVVSEHRNGALNWSTLAGELCVSRRGRQFVDSSWSCSRTVTGGAAWYTNYRACCSSPESFRGRPEDSTTPFRPTDNFSL